MSALELFDAAFAVPRDPRSAAYRAGCLAVLKLLVDGGPRVAAPYAAGSAEFDAFHAGADEGHRIAAEHLGAAS